MTGVAFLSIGMKNYVRYKYKIANAVGGNYIIEKKVKNLVKIGSIAILLLITSKLIKPNIFFQGSELYLFAFAEYMGLISGFFLLGDIPSSFGYALKVYDFSDLRWCELNSLNNAFHAFTKMDKNYAMFVAQNKANHPCNNN